jgi:hypothetical protein
MGQRFAQTRQIRKSRDLDSAELGQMFGEKLRVEQRVAAHLQAGNQMHECHFAGITLAREHALAEEGAAEADTIKTTDESIVAPTLD